MRIEWNGRTYETSYEEMTNKQAITIQKYTGVSLLKFEEALTSIASEDADMELWIHVIESVHWLMLKQDPHTPAAQVPPIADLEFPVLRFGEAVTAAMTAEAEAAKAVAHPAEPEGPTSLAPGSASSAATPSTAVTTLSLPEPAAEGGTPDG